MKISINSPSYKRPNPKILKYIRDCNIWVDEIEYDDYKKATPNANIRKIPHEVNGNIARVRNYILDSEFNNGVEAVCFMDDDLKGIYRYEPRGNYGYNEIRVEENEFLDFLEKYTELCIEFGYKLWGVNLNLDPLSYRQTNPFSTTAVVLGPFSVQIKNDIRYDENLPLKEDYDLAIQHLAKYRGILRVNKYHYLCEQSTNVGGCAVYRNREVEERQLNMLQHKWGSKIVKFDYSNRTKGRKEKVFKDYNPKITVPIKGI